MVNARREDGKVLVLNEAGNCCQAWSAEGRRLGESHSSQHALLVWIAQRKELALKAQESMFFQECTPLFPIEACLSHPLEKSHHVVHVISGPRVHGWPASRERLLSAGLSLHELVWIGPSTHEEIQREFDSLFAKRCVVSGQVFFQADTASVQDWAKERARKRMRVLSDEDAVGPDLWQHVLTPAQMQRINDYQRLQLQRASLDDGCFIVDVDHWAGSPGPSSGPHFPTLLRHGTILDLGSGKVAMPDQMIVGCP